MLNKLKQLENEMPSLELAKKLCSEYKRPLNHNVLLINAVAPMVTAGGIEISEIAQGEHQQQMNMEGMLVVMSPFTKPEEGMLEATNAVYAGEKVLYMPDSQAAFTTVVTSSDLMEGLELPQSKEVTSAMYKKYVVICMSVHNLSMVLNK